MCTEGWCIGLGQRGLQEFGGPVWNTLKGAGTEKEEKQRF